MPKQRIRIKLKGYDHKILDQSAQQSAASSEELASTSEEMSAQTAELKDTVGFFKLAQ